MIPSSSSSARHIYVGTVGCQEVERPRRALHITWSRVLTPDDSESCNFLTLLSHSIIFQIPKTTAENIRKFGVRSSVTDTTFKQQKDNNKNKTCTSTWTTYRSLGKIICINFGGPFHNPATKKYQKIVSLLNTIKPIYLLLDFFKKKQPSFKY